MGLAELMLQRAGTVRRVVRREDRFVCGLCRSDYEDPNDAQACVQRCWPELLELDPVIERRPFLVVLFRCRFCARDYDQRHKAAHCAETCRRKHIDAYEFEQNLGDPTNGSAPRRRFVPKPKPLRVVISAPARPKAAPKAAADPAAPINADEGGKPASVPAAPAPAPVASRAAAEDESKRIGNSHFIRDGARYVCKNCKKKYFTKEDVTTCWESHGGTV